MNRFLGLLCCTFLFASWAQAQDNVTFVNLQPKANQKLTDNLGSGRQGNNLASLRKGEQTFGDVKFKIEEGFLQLGSTLQPNPKPSKVEGIEVNARFSKLHILQATCYGNGSKIDDGKVGDRSFITDMTRIAEYRINYEDGSSEEISVVYGEDLRDLFFTEKSKSVSRGTVAWQGTNELTAQLGCKIRLYSSTWENPNPSKLVTTIDFLKVGDSPAAPFCVAMTLAP
jgi:hypothetical protein